MPQIEINELLQAVLYDLLYGHIYMCKIFTFNHRVMLVETIPFLGV